MVYLGTSYILSINLINNKYVRVSLNPPFYLHIDTEFSLMWLQKESLKLHLYINKHTNSGTLILKLHT